MSNYPEGPDGIRRGYPVETPVGTMYLNPVGWGVLVDNSSNVYPERPGRPVLGYRGREFYASIGIRNDGTIERCYVSKRGSFSVHDDAAPTHRAAIVAAAEQAVAEFREAHPELLAEAEYRQARLEHERCVFTLEEAREAFEEAERREHDASRARDSARKRLNGYGRTPSN